MNNISGCDGQVEIGEVSVSTLPMCDRFRMKKFYIRKCFPVYYEYIVKSWNGSFDYISVTGTEGIGKSVFYIYFFERYRHENPSITIVTASFYTNRKLKSCYVFHPGSIEGHMYRSIPVIEQSVHLYDGAPHGEPEYQKMVCFTSPNYSWFDNSRKSEYHARMCMPVWSMEELIIANDSLGIGLASDKIRERFEAFGGVARYCLSLSPYFLQQTEIQILDNLYEIDNLQKVQKMLNFKSAGTAVLHRIFHMVPEYSLHPPFAGSFYFEFASEKAFHLFREAFHSPVNTDRNTFARRMENFPQAKRFAVRMLDFYSTEQLCAKSGNSDFNHLD